MHPLEDAILLARWREDGQPFEIERNNTELACKVTHGAIQGTIRITSRSFRRVDERGHPRSHRDHEDGHELARLPALRPGYVSRRRSGALGNPC